MSAGEYAPHAARHVVPEQDSASSGEMPAIAASDRPPGSSTTPVATSNLVSTSVTDVGVAVSNHVTRHCDPTHPTLAAARYAGPVATGIAVPMVAPVERSIRVA